MQVEDGEKYNFMPKRMLTDIVRTFLHFSESAEFRVCVVESGYYDAEAMQKAARIVRGRQLLSPVRQRCCLWINVCIEYSCRAMQIHLRGLQML